MSEVTSVVSPGKLMIAGEYSVLEPGGVAIAFAVDSGIRISLQPAESDLITSPALGFRGRTLKKDDEGKFVAVALECCRARFPDPRSWHVTIEGGIRLNGEKVGLGDSASVVAGVVRTYLDAVVQGKPPEGLNIALEAHYRASGDTGSGYDVATSFLGSAILYGPPNRLQKHRGDNELLAPEYLEVLEWPQSLYWGAGFCGKGVSTRGLLSSLSATPASDMKELSRLTRACAEAWVGGQVSLILATLSVLDPALERWSASRGVSLFTPAMQEMRRIALSNSAVPRVSGAGGGDSLLVFSDSEEAVAVVLEEWSAAGYPKLPLFATGAK